tara:strand:- start:14151 stop:14453 length:303 start_codon:yes stop_codon:yes gene_type:complete
MVDNIIFIAGVHGTDKSTLSKAIKNHLDIPHYSCSATIKNQRQISTNQLKIATNVDTKQPSLIDYINNCIHVPSIALDGHFSLLTARYPPIRLGIMFLMR